jgi:hypothetical protein
MMKIVFLSGIKTKLGLAPQERHSRVMPLVKFSSMYFDWVVENSVGLVRSSLWR